MVARAVHGHAPHPRVRPFRFCFRTAGVQDAQHVAAMRAFKANLRQWSTLLKLKNMKFLIMTVPVTNAAEVESRFGNQHGEIFDAMRDETIYRFDFGGIQIEEVVK